jgi:uncharacterized protein YbbK (DUF523 family)
MAYLDSAPIPRPTQIMSWQALTGLRPVSSLDPLRILFSACLSGKACIYDGNGLGEDPFFSSFLALPTVSACFYCPEEALFGTPRALSDIHGGNGFDVLDGQAQVLTAAGEDWTTAMIEAGQRMLSLAQKHRTELAILLDMSAACGVQVISLGARDGPNRQWQKGPGVSAATLIRAGIPVLSQRDDRSLQTLRKHLEPGYAPDPLALDHHEREWYRGYF